MDWSKMMLIPKILRHRIASAAITFLGSRWKFPKPLVTATNQPQETLEERLLDHLVKLNVSRPIDNPKSWTTVSQRTLALTLNCSVGHVNTLLHRLANARQIELRTGPRTSFRIVGKKFEQRLASEDDANASNTNDTRSHNPRQCMIGASVDTRLNYLVSSHKNSQRSPTRTRSDFTSARRVSISSILAAFRHTIEWRPALTHLFGRLG